jgi:uncharacterized membrane protein
MASPYQTSPLIQFSVIGDAWQLYKRHWFVWSAATLIVMFGFSLVNGALMAIFEGGHGFHHGGFREFVPASGAVPFIISTAVSSFFLGGMLRMASNQLRGQTPRLEDLLSVTDVWFDLLLAGLLYGAATALGCMLFLIPGFIVSGLLMMTVPLVVESRLPATAAIKMSWSALKSQWLVATVFHLVLILAAVSGIVLCGVGVVFTGPLYCLALAILHREFFPGTAVGSWKKHVEPFPEV